MPTDRPADRRTYAPEEVALDEVLPRQLLGLWEMIDALDDQQVLERHAHLGGKGAQVRVGVRAHARYTCRIAV